MSLSRSCRIKVTLSNNKSWSQQVWLHNESSKPRFQNLPVRDLTSGKMTRSRKKRAQKGNVTSDVVAQSPVLIPLSSPSFHITQPQAVLSSVLDKVDMPPSSNTRYFNNPPQISTSYIRPSRAQLVAETPYQSIEPSNDYATSARSPPAYSSASQISTQFDHSSNGYRPGAADNRAQDGRPAPAPSAQTRSRGPHPPYGYAPHDYPQHDPALRTSTRYSLPQDYDVLPNSTTSKSALTTTYGTHSAYNYPPYGYQQSKNTMYSSTRYSPTQDYDNVARTSASRHYATRASATYDNASQSRPLSKPISESRSSAEMPQQQQPRYNLRSKAALARPETPQEQRYPARTRSQTPDVTKPTMTSQYLQLASRACSRSKEPQPLLIISDLNGTLLYRKGKGRTTYKPRPGLDEFLRYIFMTRSPKSAHPSRDSGTIHPMIWTSAQPETCKALVNSLLSPKHKKDCVAIWARDTLRLTTSQYHNKIQVYKRLEWVWADENIQQSHPHRHKGGKWDQTNTLLIDDSIIKALAQPYNLINLPEFDEAAVIAEKRVPAEEAVLAQVVAYIDEARWWSNVSTYAKGRPFRIGDWCVDAPGSKEQEGVRLDFVDLTLGEQTSEDKSS